MLNLYEKLSIEHGIKECLFKTRELLIDMRDKHLHHTAAVVRALVQKRIEDIDMTLGGVSAEAMTSGPVERAYLRFYPAGYRVIMDGEVYLCRSHSRACDLAKYLPNCVIEPLRSVYASKCND